MIHSKYAIYSIQMIHSKLDPDSLGVITSKQFIDEFYPEKVVTGPSRTDLTTEFYHYNGLVASNSDRKVRK